MAKLVIVPNNMLSRAAKALASKLSEKVGHRVFRVRLSRVRRRKAFILKAGTDKLSQFKLFQENHVSTPDWTTDRSVAASWLNEGVPVVCRQLLRSSEGRGIVIAETQEQIVPAPLYTKYFKKKKEFRVHVLNGEVIDVQEKRKRRSHGTERNTRIRNLANGYVFCRDGVVEPEGLRDLALRATNTLGYNLGAVDIAYNERNSLLVVLEVNANPGLEGTTLEKYADAISNWYRSAA